MPTVTVRRHTSYIVEHDGREFEVSHQPVDGTEPTIEELPNGKVVIGYLADDNTDPQNPRENENLGHMICWHRRYKLGDKHSHKDSEALWAPILGEEYEKLDEESEEECRVWADSHPGSGYGTEAFFKYCDESTKRMRVKVQELLKTKGYVILPLYLYDHSGITMSTGTFSHLDSAGWDWGIVGFIYAGPEDIERIGCKPDRVEEALKGEVIEYDHLLTGQCYGVCVDVFNATGEKIDDDACWGYLGSSYAEEELAGEVKRAAERHGTEQAA